MNATRFIRARFLPTLIAGVVGGGAFAAPVPHPAARAVALPVGVSPTNDNPLLDLATFQIYAGASVRVQVRSNLLTNTPWTTIDSVQVDSNFPTWTDPLARFRLATQFYYRVLKPVQE